MSELIETVIQDGYVKTLEKREDGTWEAKFINKKHNVVLFEAHKPLKSTVSSMVGTYIKNFDFEKDKDRGIPKARKSKSTKNYSALSNPYGKQEKRNPIGIAQRLEEKRGLTVEEIDGVIVHFLECDWASHYKFNHKDITYPLDFDFSNKEQIEIYTSNKDAYVAGISLGNNYTMEHIPKLIKWLKDGIYEQIKAGLFSEEDDVIHPETSNKYKNKMYIWMFHNYNVVCSKGV